LPFGGGGGAAWEKEGFSKLIQAVGTFPAPSPLRHTSFPPGRHLFSPPPLGLRGRAGNDDDRPPSGRLVEAVMGDDDGSPALLLRAGPGMAPAPLLPRSCLKAIAKLSGLDLRLGRML
jgi:hypothetical protein